MKCHVTLPARGAAHQWDLDDWSLVVILGKLKESFAFSSLEV